MNLEKMFLLTVQEKGIKAHNWAVRRFRKRGFRYSDEGAQP